MKNFLLFFSGFCFGDAVGIWRANLAVPNAPLFVAVIGILSFALAWIYEYFENKPKALHEL